MACGVFRQHGAIDDWSIAATVLDRLPATPAGYNLKCPIYAHHGRREPVCASPNDMMAALIALTRAQAGSGELFCYCQHQKMR